MLRNETYSRFISFISHTKQKDRILKISIFLLSIIYVITEIDYNRFDDTHSEGKLI